MSPLTPDRWRVLSPYLDGALAITGDPRTAWLAEIAARDAAPASELESLLAEHDNLQQSEFLERTTIELETGADGPSMEGQIIGA